MKRLAVKFLVGFISVGFLVGEILHAKMAPSAASSSSGITVTLSNSTIYSGENQSETITIQNKDVAPKNIALASAPVHLKVVKYDNCDGVAQGEACIITLNLIDGAPLGKETLHIAVDDVTTGDPVEITEIPLSAAVETDPQFSRLQYKSIKLTNHSSTDALLWGIVGYDNSKITNFLVCDSYTKAECADLTKGTNPLPSCFKTSRLKSGEACYVPLKVKNASSSDVFKSDNESIKLDAIVTAPNIDHVYHATSNILLTRNTGMYAIGDFNSAGRQDAWRITYFDGQEFHPVGNGLMPGENSGDIKASALAVYEGNLFVAGNSIIGSNSIVGSKVTEVKSNMAYWDGNTWHAVPPLRNVPVNVLKAWQPDPNNKDSERLAVGFNWDGPKGSSYAPNEENMLAIWSSQYKWQGVSRSNFRGTTDWCARQNNTWGIHSLAVVGQNLMAGGALCIASGVGKNFLGLGGVENRSFALRTIGSNWSWTYGNGSGGFGWGAQDGTSFSFLADHFTGFGNAPLGQLSYDGITTHINPDVKVIQTWDDANGKQIVLLGGSSLYLKRDIDPSLLPHPSNKLMAPAPTDDQTTASLAYASDDKKFHPIHETWMQGPHTIKAFAAGPESRTFYVAGKTLTDAKDYVVKAILPENMGGKVTWVSIFPSTALDNSSNIVSSILNVGNKTLYMAGSFELEEQNQSEKMNNIVALDISGNKNGNSFNPIPLGSGNVKGVTWKSDANSKDNLPASVTAMLPVSSLTIDSVRMGG
jgi:hypothetical protein